MGAPASGKSTLSAEHMDQGYLELSRDQAGGKVIDLVPALEAALSEGRSVVVDNLFATAKSRAPFISAARRAGVPVRCRWMTTSIEDSIINALHRMIKRHGRIFYTPGDLEEVRGDPNAFPIAVPFRYKKQLEKPTKDEGFATVEKVKFQRQPLGYQNKALLLDYDGTLRQVKGGAYKFPTRPEEVELMPRRAETLARWRDDGYLLLGVSNQSGIARGQVSPEAVEACFRHTNELLGLDIEVASCPHNVPPTCYCRKPQSGLGVALIEKHQLDPARCLVVGDQTTDKTFAKRLGMDYADQADFFAP